MLNKARLTLTRKALVAVIIILLPVVFTFANDYRQNRQFLEEHVLNDLEAVTEAYEGQIYLFLEMSKRRAMDFASDGFIRDRLGKINSGDQAGQELSEYLREEKLPVIEHVKTIHVISVDGRVAASTDPDSLGADVSATRFFKEALSGSHASEFDMDDVAEAGLVISVPIMERPGGDTIGIISNIMSISELDTVLTGKLVATLGAISVDKGRPETMESYLVNRDGFMITGSKFVPSAVLRQKVDTAPVRACLESTTEMTGFYPDYRGIMVAGSSMCLPSLGWTLLVEVDEAETMAPIATMRRNAVITAAVVAALIVALLILFIRRIVRPLKRMEEASRKIEGGSYDIDIPVGSNDEVGSLANTFNNMARDIEARTDELKKSESKYRSLVSHIPDVVWTADERGDTTFMSSNVAELLGYAAGELCGPAELWNCNIHPEDREMVKDAFHALFTEGKGFDVEYRFRKRNGEWLWVHDRATSTYESGGVKYADGVFYDITVRKVAEEALVRSEELLKEAQHIGRMGSWDWDIVNNTLVWSDEIYRIFGLAPHEFSATYEAFLERVHPDDIEMVQKAVHSALYERVPYSIDHRVILAGKEQKVVHEQAEVHYGPSGVPVRMTGTVQDITDRKRAEEEIESLARFPSENPNPVLRVSKEGTVLYANKASQPILEEFNATVDSRLSGRWLELVERTCSTARAEEAEISHGGAIFSVIFTPHKGSDYIYIYGRDITERKLAEFELKKLSTAIEQSVNIVFITNIEGVIEYVNPRFEEITGYTKEEIIGQTPRVLASGETPQSLYEDLWSSVLAGKTWRGSLKNKAKTRGHYWCNTVISPIRNDMGEITHFLAVQEDVTEKMKSEEQLDYLAHFDPLTGLMNRNRFMELTDEWIGESTSEDAQGALLLLDIDQFKFLNDTYGHGTGDELLRKLADIISASATRICGPVNEEAGGVVKKAMVGRLSGDEFAVLIYGFDAKAAEKGAEALRSDIENTRFSDTIGSVTVSIGVVTYPDHSTDTRQLLTHADAAMFRAKDLGRNRTHVYRPEDKDLEKMHSRLRWKGKILKALREDRIVPWFQPILDLSDGQVHHYEVLARMQDEDGKILLPGAFIEVAERFGLVGAIDRVIIEKAIATQSRLAKEGRTVSFAANLSGKNIGDEELLIFIQNKLREAGTARGCITFEITETATIGDLGRATEFIRSLRSLGCKFSLDDFGVGFTSFTYLKEMDVDFLKIDGSFIRRLHENPKDQALVKAITEVARGLHIKTIAEFVEEEKTLELLRKFGVDYAQGYLIGKPAPSVADDLGGDVSPKESGAGAA